MRGKHAATVISRQDALMLPLLGQKPRIIEGNLFLKQLQKTHPVALKDILSTEHSSAFQKLK